MLMHVFANQLQSSQQTEVKCCNSKHQCLLTIVGSKLPIVTKQGIVLQFNPVSLINHEQSQPCSSRLVCYLTRVSCLWALLWIQSDQPQYIGGLAVFTWVEHCWHSGLQAGLCLLQGCKQLLVQYLLLTRTLNIKTFLMQGHCH